ncbi:MAG: porin [Alphaproteobacteria bacterium]|nr:porin [Alphaproteobacteria bacterium]
MKKLLTTAAICGLAVSATPAQADIDLELGGYMKLYGFYMDQDDDAIVAGESRDVDIIRTSEIWVDGETVLDNGLTVGTHIEFEADSDDWAINESYAYFSGGWGRFNVGAEDGAAYLLQVAVPSADSNIDGLRQSVDSLNVDAVGNSNPLIGPITGLVNGALDYDQDLTDIDDKITYLSPIMNGFQLGLSYTPDIDDMSGSAAGNEDDVDNTLGEAYEVSFRYEGMFNNVGVNFGAGYTHVDLEEATVVADGDMSDDRTAWNIGLDLDIGPFGIGVAYLEDDYGEVATAALAATKHDDEDKIVVGVDYTTGPFKLGLSYIDIDNYLGVDGNVATDGVEADRWTGGVVYTYGPGMTFRGSISHVEFDDVAGLTTGDSVDATSLLLGTQIIF